ncbi:bystin [Striga asiatica]|uniref:Bystin n=1 Tax=Striga asiatica TaxID=4170 RepID=A0A5A7Q7Z7_STRAF|nr:bystin [Striga asiatica]
MKSVENNGLMLNEEGAEGSVCGIVFVDCDAAYHRLWRPACGESERDVFEQQPIRLGGAEETLSVALEFSRRNHLPSDIQDQILSHMPQVGLTEVASQFCDGPSSERLKEEESRTEEIKGEESISEEKVEPCEEVPPAELEGGGGGGKILALYWDGLFFSSNSSVALLKLVEMEYYDTMRNDFVYFINLLIENNCALSYCVFDALVADFMRSYEDSRVMPAICTLLAFAQRYKKELTKEDKTNFNTLVHRQRHKLSSKLESNQFQALRSYRPEDSNLQQSLNPGPVGSLTQPAELELDGHSNVPQLYDLHQVRMPLPLEMAPEPV